LLLNNKLISQQSPECCQVILRQGLLAYDNDEYLEAKGLWEYAKKECKDSGVRCPQLDSLIKKVTIIIENMDDEEDKDWPGISQSRNIDSLVLYINSCEKCKRKESVKKRIETIIQNAKPEMLIFSGGVFIMGNTFDTNPIDEVAPHKARVRSFYLSKNEVTFWEYYLYCIDSRIDKPEIVDGYSKNNPIVNVTWYDAINFCNWRSRKDKLKEYYQIDGNNVKVIQNSDGYRLPTEAEWEFAARGKTNSRFGNGNNDISTSDANFDDPFGNGSSNKTLPVGYFNKNNQSQINDLSGNVSEWCWDWYGAGYYKENRATEFPMGPDKGFEKCVRGGGYNNGKERCSVYYRQYFKPEIKRRFIGFRVAKNATP
jgi:formylglycine-generating enzyme required for sulfatase activity